MVSSVKIELDFAFILNFQESSLLEILRGKGSLCKKKKKIRKKKK